MNLHKELKIQTQREMLSLVHNIEIIHISISHHYILGFCVVILYHRCLLPLLKENKFLRLFILHSNNNNVISKSKSYLYEQARH